MYHDNPKYTVMNLRGVKIVKDVPYFVKSNDHKTTSLDLIKCMFEHNMFKEITEVN